MMNVRAVAYEFTHTNKCTRSPMYVCVYLQTCTHTITEICNKRPNGRASFLFLFYFYNIASRKRTVAHTHVRKYVCMYVCITQECLCCIIRLVQITDPPPPTIPRCLSLAALTAILQQVQLPVT